MQSELQTEINIMGDNSFTIAGKFKQKNIEKVLKQFIIQYVQCAMCKSVDTIIKKENKINLLVCNKCMAHRTIK